MHIKYNQITYLKQQNMDDNVYHELLLLYKVQFAILDSPW